MSTGNQKRTRQQRVATVELPPGTWQTLLAQLQRGSVLLRLALCTLVALFLWLFTEGWNPPFSWREGMIPARDIVARVDFEQPDAVATQAKRDRARTLAVAVYDQDPEPLIQLRAELESEIGKLLSVETFAEVDPQLWADFEPPLAAGTPDPTEEQRQERFETFLAAFEEENALEEFATRMT